MKLLPALTIFLLLGLFGCASVLAPEVFGSNLWSGKDGSKLNAQLRLTSSQLPEGWLRKADQDESIGSFAYRKRAGTYDYSEQGHFNIDASWRKGQPYIGVLNPGGVFCVANPHQQATEQADSSGDTISITYWTVYNYCAQLHRQ